MEHNRNVAVKHFIYYEQIKNHESRYKQFCTFTQQHITRCANTHDIQHCIQTLYQLSHTRQVNQWRIQGGAQGPAPPPRKDERIKV